ncbi:HAD hydrolase-like protein [Hymenobacter sp. APR13]|uniref:HAD family hydrolase n=1 Tax=Hymenobacter sp. APR13 TaxID=1356852 RepID=UPI0009005A54
MYLIFDLDQTLLDSSIAEVHRKNRQWPNVYPLIPRMGVYDGIEEIFAHISRTDTKVAVVTSSPGTYCSKVIQHYKWPIPITVCYHDTTQRKPHPAPIQLALERLGNPPLDQVYSFGDMATDITASNAAGVHSVACLWGSNDPAALLAAQPEFTFNTPHEVVAFLDKLRA